MIENYSGHEYELYANGNNWMYRIYDKNYKSKKITFKESNKSYDTKQEARFAAIGHIAIMENGED